MMRTQNKNISHRPVSLNEMLELVGNCLLQYNPVVTGLVLDSRKIVAGNVFVALKGQIVDARCYIDAAIAAGACAILADAGDDAEQCEYKQNIPILYVRRLSEKVSELADLFFAYPSRKLKVVGVTGTNGKTTCAQLLIQLFQQLGEQAATIGTMGYGADLSALVSTGLTTPDPIECQRILADFVDEGIDTVAMEVSSHAIAQGRVNNICFDGVVFTNLTRDHLDYHESLENYAATKAKLFSEWRHRYAVVNADDNCGREIAINEAKNNRHCVRYAIPQLKLSADSADVQVQASDITFSAQGLSFSVSTPWGRASVKSLLLGRFNVYNLLAVIATGCAAGYEFRQVTEMVEKLQPIRGRMQIVANPTGDIGVCVDYAHTPDALEQAAKAAREHTKNRLWIVFGCGGDRDKGKRPLMGRVAQTLGDYLVVTSDNPRTEDPLIILDEITGHLERGTHLKVEGDRKLAIEHAIASAKSGDMVLIAGKGHEDYQIVGNEQLPFSDYDIACSGLKKRNNAMMGAMS